MNHGEFHLIQKSSRCIPSPGPGNGALLGLFLVALLTGCGTLGDSASRPTHPPLAPQPTPASPTPTLEVRPVDPPSPEPRIAVDHTPPTPPSNSPPLAVATQTPPPPPLPDPATPPPTTPPPPPGNGDWVDAAKWFSSQGWSQPRPVPHGREMRFDVDGPGGTWSFMPGSKGALWNGLQVWLGFEPRLSSGRLAIHRLDVAHHLSPLASDQAASPWEKRSAVIDAGHGGRNAGTRSIAGNRFEKEFTLDCAHRLADALRKKGWTVALTRTNDTDLSLTERVQCTDAAGADLFISLHFNSAFPGREPAGLETYTVTPQGMASHVTRNYPDDPSALFPANRWNEHSLRAATAVHRAVLAGTGMIDRGVRHARFLDVLRWQNRTAILVECGYLSNPAEAARIQNAEFRQRLADAIAAGVD